MALELQPQQVRAAVTRVLTTHALDRMPSLISHAAVTDAKNEIAQRVTSLASGSGLAPRASEQISMPRGRFGSRPILVPTLHEMAYLNYLVDQLPGVTLEVRTAEQRSEFYSFSCDETESHQVQFDIASYYEYVDHNLLQQQLAILGAEPNLHDEISKTLRAMYPRGLGLPQMQRASDALADVYLAPIDRYLLRNDWHYRRYADDYRVNATKWDSAVQLLSQMGELARTIGLSMAAAKSFILRKREVERRNNRVRTILAKYEEEAAELLTQYVWIEDYGEEDLVEIPPEDEEAVEEALHKVLRDWLDHHNRLSRRDVQESVGESNPLSDLLASALRHLRDARERIPNHILVEIPFAEPVRLQAVCEYVRARPEEEQENVDLVATLTSQARQSPWARIWLCHTASKLANGTSEASISITSWLRTAVQDRSELVRAEASWSLSQRGLTDLDWNELVSNATALTHAGIAAVAGAAGVPPRVEQAFTTGDPLLRSAFEWGAMDSSQL